MEALRQNGGTFRAIEGENVEDSKIERRAANHHAFCHFSHDHGYIAFAKQTQPAGFRQFVNVVPGISQPRLENGTPRARAGRRQAFVRAALRQPAVEFGAGKRGGGVTLSGRHWGFDGQVCLQGRSG